MSSASILTCYVLTLAVYPKLHSTELDTSAHVDVKGGALQQSPKEYLHHAVLCPAR